MDGCMESMLKPINKVLQEREDKILELDEKLYKLARLARTLLSALEPSIKHDSYLNYDAKKEQSQLTKECQVWINTAIDRIKIDEEKIGALEEPYYAKDAKDSKDL